MADEPTDLRSGRQSIPSPSPPHEYRTLGAKGVPDNYTKARNVMLPAFSLVFASTYMERQRIDGRK